MTWTDEVVALRERRSLLAIGGEPRRIERQRARGKLLLRERIARLADPGTFVEKGGLVGRELRDDSGDLTGMMPSGAVTGICEIDARPVVIAGHDSTVRSDSRSERRWPGYRRRTTARAETLALRNRIPLVRLLDAPGASVRSYESAGRPEVVWNSWADASARLLAEVPVVSVVAGPAAGLPAIEVCLAHFSVLVRGGGQAFPGGPPVVRAALGQEITSEQLGGAEVLAPIGVVDMVAETEEAALEAVRHFLSYLPSSVWDSPPQRSSRVPSEFPATLSGTVSREWPRRYDPYAVLAAVVDADSSFELGSQAGPECVTAFARVEGESIGVVIRNPSTPTAGAFDAYACEKLCRFIELCDLFRLPIVSFVDEPGKDGFADLPGIALWRSRLIQRIYATSVPMLSFVIGASFGVAGNMALRPRGLVRTLAWPSARWLQPGDADSELPTFAAMEVFNVDDIIDPAETRDHLVRFLRLASREIEILRHARPAAPFFRL